MESRGGWTGLFAEYDADGSGEIDLEEFTQAIRSPMCGINQQVLSDRDLRKMFKAVDADGSGAIDVDEFVTFVHSEALAADMSLEVFSEALFQVRNTSLCSAQLRASHSQGGGVASAI